MALLRKCPSCKDYTLKVICEKCSSETKDPHYRFLKTRDSPPERED